MSDWNTGHGLDFHARTRQTEEWLADMLGCRVVRSPDQYDRVDVKLCQRGIVMAHLETKCRALSPAQVARFGDIYLSKKKVDEGLRRSRRDGVPFLFMAPLWKFSAVYLWQVTRADGSPRLTWREELRRMKNTCNDDSTKEDTVALFGVADAVVTEIPT